MFSLKKNKETRPDTDGTIYAGSFCNICIVKEYKGSFSVEAAYIMPLVLLCMFLPVWIGIELHQEMKELALGQQQEETVDMVSAMYRREFITDLFGEFYED